MDFLPHFGGGGKLFADFSPLPILMPGPAAAPDSYCRSWLSARFGLSAELAGVIAELAFASSRGRS